MILVGKDRQISLMLEEAVHGKSLEFGPYELGGFNTGSVVCNAVQEFEGTLRVQVPGDCATFSQRSSIHVGILKQQLAGQELIASPTCSNPIWS